MCEWAKATKQLPQCRYQASKWILEKMISENNSFFPKNDATTNSWIIRSRFYTLSLIFTNTSVSLSVHAKDRRARCEGVRLGVVILVNIGLKTSIFDKLVGCVWDMRSEIDDKKNCCKGYNSVIKKARREVIRCVKLERREGGLGVVFDTKSVLKLRLCQW